MNGESYYGRALPHAVLHKWLPVESLRELVVGDVNPAIEGEPRCACADELSVVDKFRAWLFSNGPALPPIKLAYNPHGARGEQWQIQHGGGVDGDGNHQLIAARVLGLTAIEARIEVRSDGPEPWGWDPGAHDFRELNAMSLSTRGVGGPAADNELVEHIQGAVVREDWERARSYALVLMRRFEIRCTDEANDEREILSRLRMCHSDRHRQCALTAVLVTQLERRVRIKEHRATLRL
jgi:hypothetical protein